MKEMNIGKMKMEQEARRAIQDRKARVQTRAAMCGQEARRAIQGQRVRIQTSRICIQDGITGILPIFRRRERFVGRRKVLWLSKWPE